MNINGEIMLNQKAYIAKNNSKQMKTIKERLERGTIDTEKVLKSFNSIIYKLNRCKACVAQWLLRAPCKREVAGSTPVVGN